MQALPLTGTSDGERDADADADLHLMVAEVERGRERRDQAFGKGNDSRSIRSRLDDDELVATEPRRRIFRAHCSAQTVSDGLLDGKTCRINTDTGSETVNAQHVVLATGSVPVEVPGLAFGGRVISSAELPSLPTVPTSLAVIGAGYIGLELGTALAKLGAKVTVIESDERILPLYDDELMRPVARRLKALGIT